MTCGGLQALQEELDRGRVEGPKDTSDMLMTFLRPHHGLQVAAIDILLRYTSRSASPYDCP